MNNNYEQIDYTKPNKKKFGKIFSIIAYFVVFAIGYEAATISFNRNYGNVPLTTISSMNKIENIIEDNYYKEYDKSKLYEYAQTSMVYGLEDPYSYYLSKDSSTEFDETISGNYVGIGVTLSPNSQGEIEVVAPFEGSPAAEAGILPGDVIYKVNDKAYMYDDIDEAVSVMKGAKGEQVKIELKRKNSDNIIVTVTKRQIEIDSVTSKDLGGNILYLRISRFDATTYDDFKSKIAALPITADTNIILDLRDNPGGVVTSSTQIADLFLEEGTIITEKYRNQEDIIDGAHSGSLNIKYPIVILANENSASASEILTGALKDHERAILIGEKTYGKGLLNRKFKINDESSIVLAIAQYTTPNGTNIHGVGIEPNINIPMELKKSISSLTLEEDIQLQRAIEYIKNR